MPIYGYVCKACGHTLDALQKISDEPLVDCPECGAAELKRQLSAPRFRLKGKGWYETDFKSDNQRNLAGDKEPGKSDGKDDKKTDKKSDSKTAVSKDKGSSNKKAVSKTKTSSTSKAKSA